MHTRTCVIASCLAASLAVAMASAPAAVAPRPITGTLSKSGYTVIALAANGEAKAVRAPRGTFRLTPPAGSVTLHLRAPDGIYAGPIVVGREANGKRAVLGVRAGARLGRVEVRRGYARVSKRLRQQWVDASRAARARKGVPIGAGVFGRVRSRPPRATVPGDRDFDGIPDLLDIDDDGDLILDNLDRSTAARAAQAADTFRIAALPALPMLGRPTAARAAQAAGEVFKVFSNLDLGLDQTANANAPGSTDQQIDAALPSFGRLGLIILPGDSAELDCAQPQSRTDPGVGGLIYCTRGGTGSVQNRAPGPGLPLEEQLSPFPGCCDPDGDGFGTLPQTPNLPDPATFLFHRATAAQIGTGDVLIQRVMRGGVETQFLTMLPYVFATVPALVSYDDGQGNSASVSYPVAGGGPGVGGPGTHGNGFPVRAGPNGDVVVTLTFWRPQRRPIPPETGQWIDIGGLHYTAGISGLDLFCQQSALSEAGPILALAAGSEVIEGGGFRDLAADRPAAAGNTLTFTLNLTECLRSPVSNGRPQPGFSFNPGEARGFKFASATEDGANAGQGEQSIWFKRQ